MIKFEESVLFFTFKSHETLLYFNGSQSWELDPNRVSKCKYLICVKNMNHPLTENTFCNHGDGFLVGKISNIRKPYNEKGEENTSTNRWLVTFNEFSTINLPNIWEGWRNPVKYIKTDELNVDFEKLKFTACPPVNIEFIKSHMLKDNNFNNKILKAKKHLSTIDNGYNIQEAKRGLAKHYKIPEQNIEIIMKG